MASKKRPRAQAESFAFVNLSHPSQAKDSSARKQVMSHAMRDHLRRQQSSKLRSSKGHWVAAGDVGNKGKLSSDGPPSDVPNEKSLERGRASALVDDHHKLENCLCLLGPRFTCRLEPNVQFLRALPLRSLPQNVISILKPSRCSFGISDAACGSVPEDTAPAAFVRALPHSRAADLVLPRSEELEHWWAARGPRDLTYLLSMHLACELMERMMSNRAASAFYLNIRHHLLNVQKDAMFLAERRISEAALMAGSYIISGDIWDADLVSLMSHRICGSTFIRQNGGVSWWVEEDQQSAHAFLSCIFLSDVFTESPPLQDLEQWEPGGHAFYGKAGTSPFYGSSEDMQDLQASQNCSVGTLKILQQLHSIIRAILNPGKFLFLGPTTVPGPRLTGRKAEGAEPRQNASDFLYQSLLPTKSLPPLIMFTQGERIHTVVRYTAILLLTAITKRIPISEAVQSATDLLGGIDILHTINNVLGLTDPRNLWGVDDMWGSFAFVALVLLPATKPAAEDLDESANQSFLRSLRAPALLLSMSLAVGSGKAFYESIQTMTRLQRRLEGQD